MEWIFWLSITLIVYSYVAYPILLRFAANLFGTRQNNDVLIPSNDFPEVAVIIAAYNEEQEIKARIENLLAQDYPSDKLTVFIGSDGSTDKTNEILIAFNDPCIKVHIFNENRGKASVLNNLVELTTQPLIVFSDANTHFESDAIKRLIRHFENENVGAVCGELNLYKKEGNDNKDNVYWRYEQFLKENESKIDALLGANGAIYALRKELYTPIPVNTIVDDFLVVMNVAKEKYRIVYDKTALAHEEIAPSIAEETKRRVRIGTGNYQAFSNLLWALNPLIGWRFFSYFSHKVLRWFTPHFMVIALISNILLLGNPIYNGFFAIQLIVYYLAYWGKKESDQGNKIPVTVAFITFFITMNLALLKGFYRFSFKNVQGTWQRTSR
jgi:cellulose synthase/poly-beta-1,6-N-acetylglucosamine synthase-like glycosyltransferase